MHFTEWRMTVCSRSARQPLCLAISSDERIKSMYPLAIALSGMCACPAVSGFCAIVMPPTSFNPHDAAAEHCAKGNHDARHAQAKDGS